MTAGEGNVRLAPPARDLRATWLIARRAALESLRDRTTLGMSAISALVLPFLLVFLAVRPLAGAHGPRAGEELGTMIASYLLLVGLMPSSGSASVAAGVFAGEKEQGNLAPLLATPASNRAIFAGKVLGAVLPALLYALIADLTYLLEASVMLGPARLRLVPPALALTMVALVPAVAVLGAAIASFVSSRVRTYQSAQLLSSLVLVPVMAGLFALTFVMRRWPSWALLGVVAVDLLIIVVSAATWRREEVMARR